MPFRDLYHVYLRSIAGSAESIDSTVDEDPVPIVSRLPPEVWTLVLEHLRRDDPEALKAAGLCCRQLRGLVWNLQMRSVTLNYFKEDDALFIEGVHNTLMAQDIRSIIARDSEILDYPRVFFVQSFRPDDRDEAKRTLKEVIERARNLRVFKTAIWSVADSVIKCLEQAKPHAPLVIETEYLPTNITELQHLTHSSCLTSLSCASPFTEHGKETLRAAFSLLLQIICTSTNLKILRLEYYSSDPAPERYPRLSPQPGDRFPAIEHLHLSGYFAVEMEKASHWANAIQWAALKSLSLGNQAIIPFLRIAKGRLTHLESLGIFWDSFHERYYLCELQDFFLECLADLPNLKSFATSNLSENLLHTICALIGNNLRSFTYHRIVDGFHDSGSTFSDPDATTPLFHERTLDGFAFLMPLLETLEITVIWRGKWPERLISAIAKFPNLRHLIISIPVSCEKGPLIPEGARVPEINKETCRTLYAMIQQEREHHFPSYEHRVSMGELGFMTSLDVKIGEWDILCKPQPRWPDVDQRRLYACRTTTSRHEPINETVEKLSVFAMKERYGVGHRFNLYQIALGKLGLENEVDAWV